MNDFIFSLPTEVYFGRQKEKLVGELVRKYSKKILLVYGEGSIKRTGLFHTITESLKSSGVEYIEFGGVHMNPLMSIAYEGIKICKRENIDFILAVGGGSVIDCAKTIALGALYQGDVWDLYITKIVDNPALPVGVVLTVPATASETNRCAVMTYDEGLYKKGIKNPSLRPVFAIMNPELTATLPDYYMAVSIVDIFAHIWERYFTKWEHSELNDRLCEAIFKTLILQGPKAVKDRDYNSMADIMWASSMAHNDILGEMGDFGAHRTGHEISGKYNLSHGGTLAITMCAWAKYVYKEDIERFCRFAVNVWDVKYDEKNPAKTALEGIARLEEFIHKLDVPTTFSGAGLPTDGFDEMAEKAVNNRFGFVGGGFKKLFKQDIINIYQLAE